MLVLVAAFASGMSKAGLAGVGMLGVTLTAMAMDGLASTGVVLPLLIFADVLAASTFRQHVQWAQIRRLAAPVAVGIVAGWALMLAFAGDPALRSSFRPIVGFIVLGMVALQLIRQRLPHLDAVLPQSAAFAWCAGILTGFTTMVANAAGPVATIYLLILAMPKNQFVHTMAWLFLFVNLSKVPFSIQLGLINGGSLALNLCQAPAVVAGLLTGKKLVEIIPQAAFQRLVLVLAAVSAAWLIFA
jgi:uncharacterized membrane protein YfcA